VSASTLAALAAAAALLAGACAGDPSRQPTTPADAPFVLTPDERHIVGCYETVAFDVRQATDTSSAERELLRPPARFALTPQLVASHDTTFDGFKVTDDGAVPPTNHSCVLEESGTVTIVWGPSRAAATATRSTGELRGSLTRDSVMGDTGTSGDFRAMRVPCWPGAGIPERWESQARVDPYSRARDMGFRCDDRLCKVPFETLLARPEVFVGLRIRTTGFADLNWEGSLLRRDAGPMSEGGHISMNYGVSAESPRSGLHRVMVTGVFIPGRHSDWDAELKNVEAVTVLQDP